MNQWLPQLNWQEESGARVFGLALLLLSVGVIMVTSSSLGPSESYTNNRTEFHFLIRHLIYVVMGLTAMAITYRIPIDWWQKMGAALFVFAVILLMVVLVVGAEVKGSRRWINLGIVTLQASEVAKLCVIGYLAGYLVRRQEEVRTQATGFYKPFAVLMIIALLLLAEPDFGAVVVLMSASLGVIYLTGVRLNVFFAFLAACLVGGVALIYLEPYRLKRFLTFITPWEHKYSGGYQVTQSFIAFGNGDLFGAGLGNSVQKLFYLPEAHTDFVFAVLAEEFGLIGNLFIIGCFAVLALSGLSIGRRAELKKHFYGAYFAYGISLLLIVQSVINIGVTLGMLPTKGLTLPLVSYGGSSLIISCCMIGILMRIAKNNEILPDAGTKAKTKVKTSRKAKTKAPKRSGSTRKPLAT